MAQIRKTCEGCEKLYWSPGADWQHRACGEIKAGVIVPNERQATDDSTEVKSRFDRTSYQREYMKKYRQRKRDEANL